eukprot:Skav212384  [mRNA]  locus=scaffold45:36539:40985:+ [translate_table: standard]
MNPVAETSYSSSVLPASGSQSSGMVQFSNGTGEGLSLGAFGATLQIVAGASSSSSGGNSSGSMSSIGSCPGANRGVGGHTAAICRWSDKV